MACLHIGESHNNTLLTARAASEMVKAIGCAEDGCLPQYAVERHWETCPIRVAALLAQRAEGRE